MANADQIKALVKSHAEGDESRFYAVAMQVAAGAARSGHGKFAQELRNLIDGAKSRKSAQASEFGARPVPLARPKGELAGLLSVSYPKTRFADMALDERLNKQMDRVLLEQRQRRELQEHGLSPIRKLLLVGPPGTGKTMTACALAGELGVPLFVVQLDGLISKYLGETAAKLRLIFDAITESRAVYFFDEFDAVGSDRSSANEVGEIRRTLNSFLQFLENEESESVVIAATNYVAHLDRALFRRFDIVVQYDLPTKRIAGRLMQNRLSSFNTSDVDWSHVSDYASGLSHADISQAAEQAAKNSILDRTFVISESELIAALESRKNPSAEPS